MREECDKLIENENILLLTLGFGLSIEHPHALILVACQNSVINKALGQMAYTVATHLLKRTTLCLRHRPSFVACLCIYLANKKLQIPVIKY